MRIQAIRGCNLASLEGEFAVDLDSGPLAASGLFAITGPTGAGKSTLLDAVCLALFAEIPRLRAAPARTRVGEGRGGDEDGLSAGDPRAILRHGSGEGYAEIDFRMPDGATYRARWAVRRARGKPDGAIQNHTHTFERTDRPENLGGTNTQTKQAIGQVIGLSAEQFTRAVLLAQGDFEALIRADADERAALLEKLTGSHIYSALGRKAFEDKRAWTEKLDAITAKITALEGLTPDAREAAQACFDAARDHHHACQTGLKALEDRQALLATRDRLAQAARRAQEACTDAQAAIAGALPRRAALARDRQALTLEPLYSRCREEAEAQTRATDARQAAAHALAETESRATASETRHNEARADHDAQTLHAQTLKPRIDKARLLEEQIAQAAGQAETLDTRRRGSARAARQSAQTLATSQTNHDEATTRLNAVKAWQDARAALRPLAERESEIAALLTSHDAARARIGEQDARLSALAQAVETAQEARDAAQDARREAEDRHTTARTALAQAQAANTEHLGAEHLAALTTRAQALAAAVLADAAARTARQQADERAQTLARDAQTLATREDQRQTLATQIAAHEAERTTLAPALDAARARHERAAQASDQAAQIMRAALHDGEPCPVCGAREHPTDALQALLGDNLVAARDEARALQDRHEALTADITAKTRQAADLDETLREARAAHEALARTCATLHAQAEAREDEARASAARADLPDAQPEARGPALAALSKANQAEIDAGLAAQRMLASLRQQQDAARAALDRADAALAAAEQTLRDQSAAHQATASEQAQTRAQQDRLAADLSHLLAPLIDWQALPDPQGWLAGQAQDWRERAKTRASLEQALPALAEALAQARLDDQRAQDAAREAARAHAEADTRLAGLRTDHAALFEGTAFAGALAATIEAGLAGEDQRLASARQAAQAAQAQALQDLAAARTRAEEAEKRLTGARDAHTAACARFEDALSQTELTPETVARVADAGREALDREEDALRALDTALSEARAVATQRENDLAAFEAAEGPALAEALAQTLQSGPDGLARALEAQAAALALAAQALDEARLVLRRDDDVRERTAALHKDYAATEDKARLALQLGSLIGDREGRIFRKYAQGLTLDRLLEHANTRLAELKPRYQLERGRGGDMVIQVIDNDMAGQVRGIHNLSGGERFMVSLALALGLAEMSTTRGVRIESLFIDEGFGALDPVSLGQALALLDQLQASGRRVGVISHVEELKERIAAKIEITPTGRGTSRLAVVEG